MRRINPTMLALGGLLLLLLLLWFFSTNRSSDQDKLTGTEAAKSEEGNPEERCASRRTYDLIKRELFRRAAQVRGSDQAAFDRLAAYATVRMESPVLESENEDSGAVNCTGSLSIDLPPGVAVVGGRRTLAADVDYSLQRAADGSGDVVLLRNADAIITPLATLARVGTPAPPAGTAVPEPALPADGVPPGQVPPAPAVPPPPVQTQEPEPAERAAARPSFNCANARSRGEIAICSDPGLAVLDRQMSAQFFRALSQADGDERALLQRTRTRFLAYRDSCRTDACIADAYRGRMREISDIVAGRWQPR